MRRFEQFVAFRYLTGRPVVTLISVAGVAFGVMALVLAMAITTGVRNTLQSKLLGSTPHVFVMEKEPDTGIANWRELTKKFAAIPGVLQSTPALYDAVMYVGPAQPQGGFLKGILPPSEALPPEPLRRLKTGKFTDWNDAGGYPPVILGWRLAERTGMRVGSVVRVMSPHGEPTPVGPKLVEHRFRVVGTFDTGFYDFDLNWGFTSIRAVQKVLSLPDVANAVEMTIADVYRAPEIAREAEKLAGPKLESEHWMAQNKQFLTALQLERIVVIFVIGLFQMAAALSIVISLTMITIQKQRDIGILMSLGAGQARVSRVFVWQGAMIGILGTFIGLVLGYLLCWFANAYELIELEESLYSIRFVPFTPKAIDGVWISLSSVAVSLLATLYPARAAARVAPAVALRYE